MYYLLPITYYLKTLLITYYLLLITYYLLSTNLLNHKIFCLWIA